MGYGDALRDEVRSDSVTPLVGIFDMCSASLAAQHSNPLSMEFRDIEQSVYCWKSATENRCHRAGRTGEEMFEAVYPLPRHIRYQAAPLDAGR
jgi:hypothetical protein